MDGALFTKEACRSHAPYAQAWLIHAGEMSMKRVVKGGGGYWGWHTKRMSGILPWKNRNSEIRGRAGSLSLLDTYHR